MNDLPLVFGFSAFDKLLKQNGVEDACLIISFKENCSKLQLTRPRSR